MLDVGLLAAMGDIDVRTLLSGNEIFVEFKGALTEQYVLRQLIAEVGVTPYYWSSEHDTGEIDLLFRHGGAIVPLEVRPRRTSKLEACAASARNTPACAPSARPCRIIGRKRGWRTGRYLRLGIWNKT